MSEFKNEYLSYSRLNRFETCPMSFKLLPLKRYPHKNVLFFDAVVFFSPYIGMSDHLDLLFSDGLKSFSQSAGMIVVTVA